MMDLKFLQDLDDSERKLIQSSSTAREKAYNIYSNFQVGAALQFSDGNIVTGCNVENSSYGLTICAERTAIVKAISEGIDVKTLVAVAVSAVTKAQIISPCGACRQFITEFNPAAKVYLHNPESNVVGITDMNYLLPGSFDFNAEKKVQSQLSPGLQQ